MNGNRGAKGSIRDRLISLLYRLRYKKKTLKEEEYNIERKKIQKEYINLLKQFEETENVNVLDSKDSNELDKIELQANFKISQNNQINNSSKKIVGINLELDNIESKSSELTQIVDLKKEEKKTNQEIIILEEVNDFIKESLTNIEELQNELEQIKEQTKNKNQDTNELEEKYKKLRQKVNKLKVQYDNIKNKYDLSEFKIIESIKLIDSIDDYKSIARLNELDMMVSVCKKEINKIEKIEIVNVNKKKVGSDISKLKEEQKEIKIKFIKKKENIDELSNVENLITNEIRYQQQIVDDMYEKASHFEKEISTQTEIIGHKDILGSLFRITGGLLTLPFSGKSLFGVALGSTLINKGLKEMNKNLETREKLVINYKYEDISKQISNVKDKVEYTNLILIDSLNEIKKLKSNFNDVFSKYNNILPEYNSIFEKIDNLEKKLKEQQLKLTSVDEKLEKEKELNIKKLKKIEKNV